MYILKSGDLDVQKRARLVKKASEEPAIKYSSRDWIFVMRALDFLCRLGPAGYECLDLKQIKKLLSVL